MSAALALTAVLAALLVGWTLRARRRRGRLLATVSVVTLPAVASRHLGNRRDIRVYLPPGYAADTARRYPVLYLNDGQEDGALGLRETMARLVAAGRVRPFIAVSVPTNEDRLHEYGTARAANARGLGSRAAAYADFIVDEVVPLVQDSFRTDGEAAFLGASLGGLSAFDIAWNHADAFNAVGVFSGSFWWHTGAADGDPRIAHAMVREAARPARLRCYFQAGTRDEVADRDANGIIDAIQDTLELMDELAALGYERGREMVYLEVAGGRHDWETWARVLPDFLTWAFSTRPGRQTERPSSDSRPPR